ncbi:hypothetical protein GYA49_02085 [Candidatus Beckwithbacteria bacterium]|nr:hypothetical protein [Candidatus Beckwithbacteria bacterium]
MSTSKEIRDREPDFSNAIEILSRYRFVQVGQNNILYANLERNSQLEDRARTAQNLALIITGPSGVGKDAVVNKLLSLDTNPPFSRVKTATSRKPRDEEKGLGKVRPYFYIPGPTEFIAMVEEGKLIEYVSYGGNYYGLPWRNFRKAHGIPIIRVDPKGAETLMTKWQNRENLFSNYLLLEFFILPESKNSLISCLRNREGFNAGANEMIARRLAEFSSDISRMPTTSYAVINKYGYLNETVQAITHIANLWQGELII